MSKPGSLGRRTRGGRTLPTALLVLAGILVGSLAASLALPGAGADSAADQAAAAAFTAPIERAQGLAAWRGQPAVEAGLTIDFGGKTALQGRLLFKTDMSASRLELADGTTLVWDGAHAWVSPAAAETHGARFHLLTWPYFLSLPMKLSDPGARLAPLGERPLLGKSMPAARMTFAPGTGDTPDDWYVLYRDPESDRLAAVAYVVTYGKSREQAEKEPHSLVYSDFETVGGVTLATRWTFYAWDAQQGVHGDPIGAGSLSGLTFLPPPAGAFDPPPDRREDALPPRP